MCERVKRGKLDVVSHHGLIKLIIFQKLQGLTPPISWVRFTHSRLEHEVPSKKNSRTPSPPIAKKKGFLSQNKPLKKKSKRNNVEVSNKEVVDTLIHFSTPMKSKKPRIIVRPPSSPPKPIKRVKSRSQAQASNAAITYALEVF